MALSGQLPIGLGQDTHHRHSSNQTIQPTGDTSSSKSQNQQLVSGMFSERTNDADFMLIAKKWNALPKELAEAIVKTVEWKGLQAEAHSPL